MQNVLELNLIRFNFEIKSFAAVYLLILNVVDWISTYLLIQTGQVVEINHLVFNLHTVKFIACLLCLVIIFKSPQTTLIKRLLLFTNTCYSTLTVWHAYLWYSC